MADKMRIKKNLCEKEEEEETTTTRRLHAAQLTATNVELKRVQTELRITKILKQDLEMKLDKTRNELLKAQTKMYTTSQKQQRILNYIDWLDEYYENEASSRRVVSTKFIRDNL